MYSLQTISASVQNQAMHGRTKFHNHDHKKQVFSTFNMAIWHDMLHMILHHAMMMACYDAAMHYVMH